MCRGIYVIWISINRQIDLVLSLIASNLIDKRIISDFLFTKCDTIEFAKLIKMNSTSLSLKIGVSISLFYINNI